MLTVSCPHCRQTVVADPQLAGRIVACPGCHRQFPMPLADPPLASPPVTLSPAPRRPVSRQPAAADYRPLIVATGITLAIVLVVGVGIVIALSMDSARRASTGSAVAAGTGSAAQRQTTPLERGPSSSDGERLPEVDRLIGRTFSANHPDAKARMEEAHRRGISIMQSGDKVQIGDVKISNNPISDYGGFAFGLGQHPDGTLTLTTDGGDEPLRIVNSPRADRRAAEQFLQRHHGAANVKVEQLTDQPYYLAKMAAEDGRKVDGIQHGRSREEIQKSLDRVAEITDASRVSIEKLERIGSVVHVVYRLEGSNPVRCDDEFLVLNDKVVYRFGSSREAILD